ncbi:MAG: aspartate-alanine antiporter [Bacteroides sp.]|nr:aspartate-alanine antiporter [Bacteroides sp.]
MESFFEILRHNPVIPIFLTIGIGFWLGHLKYKSFSLGAVAATLLVGVIIGQIGIEIPAIVKNIFFMLFLFSIGYSVGPQFFRAFKGDGLKQLAFAVVGALVCAGTVILAAKIMGYDTGVAVGMFAGSQTASASLGVTSETIRGLAMSEEAKQHLLDIIPTCYAVTYVFGTIGSAWYLSNIGPMLLGGMKKVKAEIAEIERALDDGEEKIAPGMVLADTPVTYRVYRADNDWFSTPRSIDEVEDYFASQNKRIFVERLRLRGKITDPSSKVKIRKGDLMVLSGRSEVIVEESPMLGQEIADHELLNFGAENLPVTVARKDVDGMTFGKLRQQPFMKGVLVSKIARNNMSLPGKNNLVLERGDVLTLCGSPRNVANAAKAIGYEDRQSVTTDMVLLGLGIALGCFVGALAIHIGGVPVSLSTSGGALLSGLFFGWLRNRRPTFGHIPDSVIWIFDNLGLNMFIAVVGLSSGATFISGLKEVGFSLFFVGIIATLFALTVNIFIARKLFKFSAPETLGCVAGARCGVASIGAIQDALESTVPVIGYTVTYAAANLILVFSSLLVLAFV